METSAQKKITVVIPVYNEEKNIRPLIAALEDIFTSLSYAHDFLFVDDGSCDGTVAALEKEAARTPRVQVLVFARNFGKEVALSAGCHIASGDAVITMDADLQHPPSLIPDLIKKWEGGAEVVYTVRKENRGASVLKKTTSSMYWWLFDKISSVKMEPHSTDFRLLDRSVVDIFRQFSERGRIFRGIVDWIGFRRARIEFVAPQRVGGNPSYSYKKLFALAINSLTAFSLWPLRMAGYIGVAISLVSGILLAVMLFSRIFGDPLLFTSLAILATGNTFFIGIVLVSLGFIALYIARIHEEVINRPLYIVREKVNISED